MELLCIKCKGKGLCGKPCKILKRFIENAPKPKIHFTGKSAPEIFVGRFGYPNVNSGILTPSENDLISNFPTAESWSKNNFSIANVLRLRGQLIYGKSNFNIKSKNPLKKITQELALASKPVSTEIFLYKKPTMKFIQDSIFSPMTNFAPLKNAKIEDNIFVPSKVEYLASDTNCKAQTALNELYHSKITVDHLQKLLSAGLLGKSTSRKMVPTRWSITATDDIVSKDLIEKIKYFNSIDEIQVFSSNFVGNYIEAILLPGNFSFEAIEAWLPENFSENQNVHLSVDAEGFLGRKTYASNVTGGYYAMRLPLTEYLFKIKKQATVLVFREIRPEYYAPLGVGIVREVTRRAFNSTPKNFETILKALEDIQSRINFSVDKIKETSSTLKDYKKQKSLKDFI